MSQITFVIIARVHLVSCPLEKRFLTQVVGLWLF